MEQNSAVTVAAQADRPAKTWHSAGVDSGLVLRVRYCSSDMLAAAFDNTFQISGNVAHA